MLYILTPTFKRDDELIKILNYLELCEIDFFWIIRDNSSSDHLKNILQNSKIHKKIIYLRNNKNIGPLYNTHELIKDFVKFSHAETDVAIFITDDDVFTTNGLETISQVICNEQSEFFAFARLDTFDGIKHSVPFRQCCSYSNALHVNIDRSRVLSGVGMNITLANNILKYFGSCTAVEDCWYPMQVWLALANSFTVCDNPVIIHTIGNKQYWYSRDISDQLTWDREKVYDDLSSYFISQGNFVKLRHIKRLKTRYKIRQNLLYVNKKFFYGSVVLIKTINFFFG